MCLRHFGLYCSACLGNLFVSILCMCCSHFSWYCFISLEKWLQHIQRILINALYVNKWEFCASSWRSTKVILRCTASQSSRYSDTLPLPQPSQGTKFSMSQTTEKCTVWLQQLTRSNTVFRARVFRVLSRSNLSSLFRVVTQGKLIFGYPHIRTICGFHLQASSSILGLLNT